MDLSAENNPELSKELRTRLAAVVGPSELDSLVPAEPPNTGLRRYLSLESVARAYL
jgi:hypothetical protein